MRVAIIGNGNVGTALGPGIVRAGHDVVYGVRDPGDGSQTGGNGIPLKSVSDAASAADAVILAVHWGSVEEVLAACGDMEGKILVDCTNALDFQNNLAPLVPPDQSVAAIIAGKTRATVVKAFNQVGADVMAKAGSGELKPLQFVASDDPDARAAIIELATKMGFDARDAGGLEYARELEAMARLWIAQAFFHAMPATSAWLLTTADI